MKLRRTFAFFLLSLLIAPRALAAPPPLSVYGKLPGFEMASMSRTGERIAVIGVVNDERRLLVFDAALKLQFSAQLGDAKIRGVYWAGEGTVLIYKSDTRPLSRFEFTTDKVELFSMLVVPLDGKEPWYVFAGNRSITGGVNGFHGVIQKGDRYFGYFGGITYDNSTGSQYLNSMDPVLYEVDLADRKTRKIASRFDGDGRRRWIVGPDGNVRATLDFRSKAGDWSIRNAEGKRIAAGTQPTGGVSLIGLASTPDTIVYAVDAADGDRDWIELPLAGGEGKPILDGVGISATVFDERSRQLMGYEQAGDRPSYRFFDARRQKVMDGTTRAFPGKSVHLEDWNEDFSKLIVMTEGAGDPQTWWLVDINTGKASDLGRSYALKPQETATARMVRYKAADGLDISAVLTVPPGVPEENLPVVVMPHGGPAGRDYPGFDWWAQAFASRGYAVLQPNFRGSTGYSVEFQRAGDGEWGRKMQSDISDGLAFIAQRGIVDPRRACIVGASYGGYAALAGVTLQKGIYRCAVAVAGIGDLQAMVQGDAEASGDDPTLMRALKQEIGWGRDLKALSPIRFVDAVESPILLVHGKDDTVVRYEQSASMARALRAAGKPVEFLTLAGEDHWLSKGETRLAMLEAVLGFVEKHNPADPGP